MRVRGVAVVLTAALSLSPTVTAEASPTKSFTVVLKLRDGAERFALDVSTPGNPLYGRFLSPEEFNARYAPTSDDVARVRDSLAKAGFSVGATAEGNRWISATGVSAQLALRNAEVLAVSEDVPAQSTDAVAPTPGHCSAFWGQYSQTLPAAYDRTSFPTTACGYNADQLQTAYGLKPSIVGGRDGHGVTVAVIGAYGSPTMPADADTHAKTYGQSPFKTGQYTQKLFKPTGPSAPCGGRSKWYRAQTRDVEAIHAVAPGANVLYVGARDCAAGVDEAINWVVQHKPATIVSNSYTYGGENLPAAKIQQTHSLLVQAAAEGIGFSFASGDSGDETVNGIPAQPDYPASDPLVTAVGGTSLAVDQAGGRQFETGWGSSVNRIRSGAYVQPQPGTFTAGSGGGTSSLFAQPDYQKRKVPASLSRRYGGDPMRVSPDVSAAADPYTGFVIGQTVGGQFDLAPAGGTGLACSLFAGVVALAATGRATPIGFANPLLYKLKAGSFTDILPSRTPLGVAVPDGSALVTFDRDSSLTTTFGYDAVTGLGTPAPGFLREVESP